MTSEEIKTEEARIFEELREIIVENKLKKGNEAFYYIPGKVGDIDVIMTIREALKLRIRALKQPEDIEKSLLKVIENKFKKYFFGC